MKRVKLLVVAGLLFILMMPMFAIADEAPYYTLTQNYFGRGVYSPNGYLPDLSFSVFDGQTLKRPADLFVDEHDTLYIADSGNKRVVRCTLEGEFIQVYGEDILNTPEALYVRHDKLYVADRKLEQVIVFDIATGSVVFELSHPQVSLYGIKSTFRPLKIAVDESGGMYVISAGNTNGIAQFSADGTFLGYFGANDTALSLIEKLKRLTYTQEQLNTLKKNVPPTPTSIDMDAQGLVYTVTTGVDAPKRLSMSGLNIMDSVQNGFSNAVDIAVGPQETIFVVNEQGYIIEYSQDGRTLFYFAGEDIDRTRIGLFVAAAAIDVDSEGRLYVLDRDKALVQRFETTEYANLVHTALSMYQNGLYAQSREPWEKVAQMNSMFDYAQRGLGKAYYKLEMYEEALQSFRFGGDWKGYSDAYWEIRNVWLQEYILWIFAGIAAFVAIRKLWRLLKVKNAAAAKVSSKLSRLGDKKLLRELRFMTYFIKNPSDAYYGVRFENKVSVLSSTILYVLFFAIYMVDKYATGFLFKTVPDGYYQVFNDLVLVIGGGLLFIIACNLICSIKDGEGTFKQMYCGFAYALTPYLILRPIHFALSYVLTYNESFILTCLNVVMLVGCFVLIIMMVKTLQNYTFKQTLVVLLLTLFTMLMLVIALVIAAALVMQLLEFITSVWKEARFYNEG